MMTDKWYKNKKFILDAACGGRQMWVNKAHPNAVYIDIRNEKQPTKLQPWFSVQPDLVMDNRKMEFPNSSFKLIVWDPPHLKTLGETSHYRAKYGGLNPETWQSDLKRTFSECWRVLDNYGILIFKWNEYEIPYRQVLRVIGMAPLFQNTMGNKSKTYWACFMKIPNKNKEAGQDETK